MIVCADLAVAPPPQPTQIDCIERLSFRSRLRSLSACSAARASKRLRVASRSAGGWFASGAGDAPRGRGCRLWDGGNVACARAQLLVRTTIPTAAAARRESIGFPEDDGGRASRVGYSRTARLPNLGTAGPTPTRDLSWTSGTRSRSVSPADCRMPSALIALAGPAEGHADCPSDLWEVIDPALHPRTHRQGAS